MHSVPDFTIHRPVFLVGCPRSGTTLLQRMLDAHPEVAVAPETHFMRRFWQQRYSYGPLQRDAHFEQLLQDIVATPEFQEMGLQAASYQQDAWTGPRTYPALFGLMLHHFARQRGVLVVGEKTPDHLLHISTLQEFFPEARFVHIVRDPRAVVNSLRSVPWSKGSVARDAEVWRTKLAAARRTAPQLGGRLHTIHYEHLVAAPEPILYALCRFLEIPYAPSMLTYYEEPVRTVNLKREPWKSKAARPLDPDALDRWRTDLSPSMIAEIEAVTLFEMRRWSYEAETDPLLPRYLLHATTRQTRRFRNQLSQYVRRHLPAREDQERAAPTQSLHLVRPSLPTETTP